MPGAAPPTVAREGPEAPTLRLVSAATQELQCHPDPRRRGEASARPQAWGRVTHPSPVPSTTATRASPGRPWVWPPATTGLGPGDGPCPCSPSSLPGDTREPSRGRSHAGSTVWGEERLADTPKGNAGHVPGGLVSLSAPPQGRGDGGRGGDCAGCG